MEIKALAEELGDNLTTIQIVDLIIAIETGKEELLHTLRNKVSGLLDHLRGDMTWKKSI